MPDSNDAENEMNPLVPGVVQEVLKALSLAFVKGCAIPFRGVSLPTSMPRRTPQACLALSRRCEVNVGRRHAA